MNHLLAEFHALVLRTRRRLVPTIPQHGWADVYDVSYEYELEKMKASIYHMFLLSQFGICTSILSVVATQLRTNAHKENLLVVLGIPVMTIIMHLFTRAVMSKLSSPTATADVHWRLCIAHQFTLTCTSFLWVVLPSTTTDFTSPDSQLLAHRMFLIRFIMLGMGFTYLPLRWHLLGVSLQSFFAWITFHWIMDFLSPQIWFIGLAAPCFEMCRYHTAQSAGWKLYRLVEQEKQARQLSESLMSALRGVLNVTFDASCECEADGRILSSSQHWNNLLDDQTNDMTLRDFAATEEEATRIDTFLRQVCFQTLQDGPSPSYPMAQIQTVLKSQMSREEIDVKLCCVALRNGCSSKNTQSFFVGLQKVRHLDQLIEFDEKCFSSASESTDHSFFKREPVSPTSRRLSAEGSRATDGADSHELSNLIRVRNDQLTNSRLQYQRQRADFDINSELSLSLTNTSSHVPGGGPFSSTSVACQTEELPKLVAAAAQTEASAARFKPPIMPKPSRQTRITFRSSKALLRQFRATPAQTVKLLLLEMGSKLNPAGQSCCGFHLFLHVVDFVLKEMKTMRCSNDILPENPWQCRHCFAINDISDDDDDDDDDESDGDDRDSPQECCVCSYSKTSNPGSDYVGSTGSSHFGDRSCNASLGSDED